MNFILAIIEAIMIMHIATYLFQIKSNWKYYISITVLNALLVCLVRDYLGLMGIHTIVSLSFLILYTKFYLNINWFKATTSIIVASIVMLIGETTVILIVHNIEELNLQKIIENKKAIYHFLSLLSKIPPVIFIIVARKSNFYLSNLYIDDLEILEGSD